MVVGAGFGGIAAGVKMKRRRDPHVHDLRVVARHRRHLVGQHLPRRRGRRRLAPLLVLVQVARLDAHPRQAGRAAEVPRGDRRRVRAAAAPPPRRRRGVGRRGTTTATSGPSASTTAPPTSATCSSAGSASSTSLATPTGRGSTTSSGPSSTPSRWEHQHDLTDKVVAVVGTGSTATQIVPAIQPDGEAPLPVPAGARLGHAQGRPRLHRRGAQALLATRGAAGRSASG